MVLFYYILTCGNLFHDIYFKNIILPVVLGALTSVWSNVLLEFTLNMKFIFVLLQHTHYIIVTGATISLIHGLTKKKRHFLLPWLNCKGIECFMCLIYLMLYFDKIKDNSEPLHIKNFGILGLGIIITNLYLMWYIWKTFKTMPELSPKYIENDLPENVITNDISQKFEDCSNVV